MIDDRGLRSLTPVLLLIFLRAQALCSVNAPFVSTGEWWGRVRATLCSRRHAFLCLNDNAGTINGERPVRIS